MVFSGLKSAQITNVDGTTTGYEYDDLDRLWKITDAEDNITENRYDAAGQLLKVIDAEDNDSITYTYNKNGGVATGNCSI